MFLNLEAGFTRGEDPVRETPAEHAQAELLNPERVQRQAEERDWRLGGPKEGSPAPSSEGAVDISALRSGDTHYRAYIGAPQEWDLVAARQVTLLLIAGLQENHRLVDVGCGSLRAGRMFIPYLAPDCYFGIEPNRWLVEEGIDREMGHEIIRMKRPSFRFVEDFSLDAFGVKFDFALAHSVFSHTYPDFAITGLRGIAGALAPTGKLFATFVEGESDAEGSGWLYPGLVSYTWEKMQGFIEESGLVARRIDWMQPRQSWFVAAPPEAESEIDDLSRQLRVPRVGGGSL